LSDVEFAAYAQLIAEATTRQQLEAMRERIKRDDGFAKWSTDNQEALRRVFTMRWKAVT
jgi:predicted phage gp36 major capsid-like protein